MAGWGRNGILEGKGLITVGLYSLRMVVLFFRFGESEACKGGVGATKKANKIYLRRAMKPIVVFVNGNDELVA